AGFVVIVAMVSMFVIEVRRFVVRLMRVVMLVLMAMVMTVMIMLRGLGVNLALMEVIVIDRCRGVAFGALDDLALHALAAVASARTTVARAPAAVTMLVFLLGLAMGAFIGLDQRLTVRDRDLIVVGMDFAEGKEAMAVAAIFDEGRLQRWFDARDL